MKNKILVIGDSCIDIFRYGTVERLAPEAPIPILKPTEEVKNEGMAGNVKNNLVALGNTVKIVTNKTGMMKIRYVCSTYNHPLLRIDENDTCENINQWFELSYMDEYDAVVISDYCKGFLTEKDIEKIVKMYRGPVFLDTKKQLGKWAWDVDFIKINYEEYKRNETYIKNNKWIQDKIILTRGKHGCDYKGKNYPTTDVPVKDISGAGDTFLAGFVTEYLETSNVNRAIKFAQECTTKVVQKKGVSTV